MRPRTLAERFSQYETHELTSMITTYEGTLNYMSQTHRDRTTQWLASAKEELTMRLIAGDDYATYRPDEEGSKH